jgi:hypothetical protein
VAQEISYTLRCNDGARATGKALPPPMIPSMLARSMFFVLIKRK